MIKKSKIQLPNNIAELSSFKTEKLFDLVTLLYEHHQVIGVLLGGSITYKINVSKSDIDLFCLIQERNLFEINLPEFLTHLSGVDETIFQGYFPWTENLHTIYFKNDPDFSIDLCLIGSKSIDTFFWEPDGHIIFDKLDIIGDARAKQKTDPGFTKQPFLKSNPFSLAVITVKKIEKNLSRNHLWNALEQLNIFRRYIMQIVRHNIFEDYNFLGRVDRDIEDVISPEINSKFAKTIADYEVADIARKSVELINTLLTFDALLEKSSEIGLKDWIGKQMEHEKCKLSKYFLNA